MNTDNYISEGALMAVFTATGTIDGAVTHGSGVYAGDTRFLTRLTAHLANIGARHTQKESGPGWADFRFFARRPGSSERVDLVLTFSYRLHAPGVLVLTAELLNASQTRYHDTLRVETESSFDDIFEVRDAVEGVLGIFLQSPIPRRPSTVSLSTGNGFFFERPGLDGVLRRAELTWHTAPQRSGTDWLEYDLDVPAGRRVRIAFRLELTEELNSAGEPPSSPVYTFFHPSAASTGTPASPPAAQTAETEHDGNLQSLAARSRSDLESLLLPTSSGFVPSAGIPWYHTLFGRDALLTALETLPEAPGLVRNVLVALGRFRGTRTEERNYEEPGKIPHELRHGELANGGWIPFAPFFGSVDATPLFVMVLSRYLRHRSDDEALRGLTPALVDALHWISTKLERDGYIYYRKGSYPGPTNMGWKDSDNAIPDEDGASITGEPIALCEVQAYAYGALTQGGRLLAELGKAADARTCADAAAALAERFRKDFWMSEEDYPALALRAGGSRVAAVTSNPAHGLLTGLYSASEARLVAERLVAPDVFSGFGLRTLSSSHPGYSPVSYHRGSVWPHDTAVAAMGLLESGFPREARRLAGALLDAASAMDYRLPELFCGFPRAESSSPVLYPDACLPAAWGAGAGFAVTRILGATEE